MSSSPALATWNEFIDGATIRCPPLPPTVRLRSTKIKEFPIALHQASFQITTYLSLIISTPQLLELRFIVRCPPSTSPTAQIPPRTMPPLHMGLAPVLAVLLAAVVLGQNNIPYYNDGNDHWEALCPPHLNRTLESNFRHSATWNFHCDTNSDISPSQSYPYQLQIKSTGVPDHTTTLTITPSTHAYKTPLLKPLPGKGDDLLLQNTYKRSTLGTGPIGFAVNGVPFYSALSADNVNR